MVIQRTPTKIDKIVSLRIGQHQENAATQIKMDVSDWITVHPTAGFHILFKRPGEVQAQPVLSSLEEGILTWTVQEWETSLIGVGYAEVRAIEAESALVAKSRVIPCSIEESVIEDGEVPPEYSGWVEQVLAAADTIETTQQDYEETVESLEQAIADGIEDIQAEGQTQIAAVHSEGTTQVGAVQAKGTEVLNSIPSDYSTLSGDVTSLKSALSLLSSATAIVVDDELSVRHDFGVESNVKGISFAPNSDAFNVYMYADKLHLPYTKNATYTYTDTTLQVVAKDDYYILNGTGVASNKSHWWGSAYVSGLTGNYKLYAFTSEEIPWRIGINVYKSDGTSAITNLSLAGGVGGVSSNNIDMTNATKYEYRLETRSDSSTYNNAKIWFGLFPADVAITKTETVVENPHTLAIDGMMRYVDTMMCQSSVRYVANTKNYVDNLEVDVADELVYLSPEKYGAIGDGVADDTVAVQACIDDAQSNKDTPIGVRGYRIYKTSSPITIHGRYLDVYINQIVYTGNDAALIIHGNRNHFRFNHIKATTGANATGIRCSATETPANQWDGYSENLLECTRVESGGNTLEIIYPTTAVAENTYYNVFKFTSQYSTNGNIIYVDSLKAGEIDIYGKHIVARNGYCAYFNRGGGKTFRLHQYSIESGVKNGIRGNCVLIDCRTVEMIDQRSPDNLDSGVVFDFSGVAPSAITLGVGSADMTSFKLDNAKTFDDLLNDVKTAFESGKGATAAWGQIPVAEQYIAKIETIHRSAGDAMAVATQRFLPPGILYIYYQHMAYKPRDEWYYQVNEGVLRILHTAENNYNYITPTVFDINSSSSIIYLDYSYCMIAINKFKVIQREGKTAKVYDKLGNLIFDGTNLGNGVYTFECSFVPLESLSVTLEDGTVKTAADYYVRKVYTGENEKWTVSKQEVIA